MNTKEKKELALKAEQVKKQDKKILRSGVVLLVVGVVCISGILWYSNAHRQDISNYTSAMAIMNDLQAKNSTEQKQISLIGKNLSDKSVTHDKVVDWLGKVTLQNNLAVLKFQEGKTSNIYGVNSQEYIFQVGGSFTSISNFVTDMQAQLGSLKINSVSLREYANNSVHMVWNDRGVDDQTVLNWIKNNTTSSDSGTSSDIHPSKSDIMNASVYTLYFDVTYMARS